MRGSVGGDVEMGPRGSVADRIPAPSAPAAAAAAPPPAISISLSSRLLYSLFGEKAVKAWRKDSYKKAGKTDPEYGGDDWWQQTPYFFLYLQLASAVGSFIVAAIQIDVSQPAWDQYTNFYGLVVNSGIPTAAFSLMKMSLIDERGKQLDKTKIRYFVLFPLWVLAPPFLTHIFPMMIMYFWILVPAVVLFVCSEKFAIPIVVKDVRDPFANYIMALWQEIWLRFSFIFMFHTLFNWGSLLYTQGLPITPEGYIGVLMRDWHLRSQTQCFLSHAANSALGVVVLFSWF